MNAKNIAILIKQPSHGTSLGREALDATLALSDQNKISLYFIGAGIFHLIADQDPTQILSRNYIKTFKLLDLYDIDEVYYSKSAAEKYNLDIDKFCIAAQPLSDEDLHHHWRTKSAILTF